MIIKKLKRWGNNLVVVFTSEEEEMYGVLKGEPIEINDMLKQKVKRKLKNDN